MAVNIPVLNPSGLVGSEERDLMVFTLILGMVVIIPVFAMTIVIAWRYREGNLKAKKKYTPDWDRHRLAEFTWWGIPIIIITILSVVTWVSTHALDPYKPLASKAETMKIQVVSLDWKWLFIYPEQNIASVNFVQFPKNTPIDFEITSDSVMNSFWIPELGSQIYSMPGMVTHVHLIADKSGNYNGSSANISGEGFAGMKFIAKASSKNSFNSWVQTVKRSNNPLDKSKYDKLAKPSKNNSPAFYSSVNSGLYDNIVMKYMMHDMGSHKMSDNKKSKPSPRHKHHQEATKSMPSMGDMQGMDM